ncbi:T9SS type A sorting domain-containing protein [Flavobacterium sp.]|uniref:T9SS type A sorting domain-containing protein n=1 Tax=Flavobacterium sp. TaxID=239 RepID=UPI0028BE6691|nr:T9SS type A sorting domain-containing protein [Flavobacterium sp.]
MKQSYLLLLLIFTFGYTSSAQIGSIDNSFNTNDDGTYEQNIGINSVLLADGKLLAVYEHPTGIMPYRKIIRLNPNGSIDPTFNFTDQGSMTEIFVKSDGKFMVPIDSYNDISGNMTVKCYNADGSLNTGFSFPVFENMSSGSPDNIRIIDAIYQNDGKIIIVGDFNKVNNIACNNIIRLNSDGSVDTTFTQGVFNSSYGYWINTIAMQPDGKYIVAGEFPVVATNSNARIARLNANGTLDTSFNVNTTGSMDYPINGIDGFIEKVAVQTDGKILIANSGGFRTNGIMTTYGLIRLNSNGTRDTGFTHPNINGGVIVSEFCIQPDGKILYSAQDKIKRVNTNGSIDASFNYTNPSYVPFPCSLYMQSGKVIINGDYNEPSGLSRKGIYRLNANGSLDTTFNPCSGTNLYSSSLNGNSSPNHNLKVLSDGSFLIMGTFTSYNDNGFNHMCKISPNGAFDSSFTIDSQITFTSSSSYDQNSSIIREQNDGKILFTSTPTITASISGAEKELVRINANGSLDTSFTPVAGNDIIDYEIQNDGKIIAIGTGPLFMQSSKYKVIRLNTDGSLDSSFTSMLFDYNLTHIELQSDMKILVTHPVYYPAPTYVMVPGLQRLNTDGTLDSSFNTTQGRINYTKIQPDGKILISYFNNTINKTYLGRLNADGTNDTSFTLNYGPYTSDSSLAFDNLFITSQGKIIVKTIGTYFNDLPITNKFYILSSNGVVENSFITLTDFSNGQKNLSQQNCDDLLIDGSFSTFEGVKKNNIVRYNLSNITTVNTPTGQTYQSFTNGQTLSNLVVNGQNIQWYSTQNSCTTASTSKNSTEVTMVLPDSTPLVNGTTYYASQTINNIESTYRLPVTVHSNLSTNEVELDKLRIFPNPTHSTLTVANDYTIDNIEVYNLTGQKLITKGFTSNNAIIDVSSLTSGVYMLKVFRGEEVKSIQFIKQ